MRAFLSLALWSDRWEKPGGRGIRRQGLGDPGLERGLSGGQRTRAHEPPVLSGKSGWLCLDLCQGLYIRRPKNPSFRNNGSHILGWSYIKGRVFNADTVWGELFAGMMCDFHRWPLFNRNESARSCFQINRGPGSCNIERDSMLFGQNGNIVGSNLIGNIAICGDAVGSDNYRLDFTLSHETGGHIVTDYCRRDPVVQQLPGREARSLQERTGLIGKNVDFFPLLDSSTNDSKRCAISTGSQRTGVAVGQDPAFGGQQSGPVGTHRLTCGDVFLVHRLGFADERFGNCLVRSLRLGQQGSEAGPHPVDGPEKIYSSRTGGGQSFSDLFKVGLQVFKGSRLALLDTKGNAHGG